MITDYTLEEYFVHTDWITAQCRNSKNVENVKEIRKMHPRNCKKPECT